MTLVLKNQDPTPISRISANQDLVSPLQWARNKISNLPHQSDIQMAVRPKAEWVE